MDDIIEVAEAEPEADASAVDISPTPPAQGPIDTATDKFEIEEVEAQLPAMTSGPTAALSTGFSPRHRRDTIVSRPLPAPAQRSDAWVGPPARVETIHYQVSRAPFLLKR